MSTMDSSSTGGRVTSFLHRTDRGELTLSLPAPTVLVFKYKGYSDAGFMDFVEEVYNRELASKPEAIQVFVDTEEQTGYAHGFRTRMMEWSKRMVAHTDVYVLMVKSRLVAMGIAIVRATVGLPASHAEVTTSRKIFETKLDEAVKRSLARRPS